MDAKAMAKSKRSHTLHHQPKKPHHRSKALTASTSSSSSHSNEDTKKEAADKERENRRSRLPSNWDRYEEEEEEGRGGGVGGDLGERRTDVVKPKSKGADYRVLVSEAKEKARAVSVRSPSFDDSLPDLYQGLGPLLAVRGENLVSWIGADDFLPDETIPVQEAPFLSLNLHMLAERLAKIDLAKRLFLEDDLLPPELIQEINKANKPVPAQAQTTATDSSGKSTHRDLAKREKFGEVGSSSTPDFGSIPGSSAQSQEFVEQVSLAKNNVDRDMDALVQFDVSYVGIKHEQPPSFQAAYAEEELDMLLDSFSDMTALDPSNIKGHTSAVPREDLISTSASLSKRASSMYVATSQPSVDRGLSSSVLHTLNLDDTLDDLLNETIGQTTKDTALRPLLVKSVAHDNLSSSSSRPGPKSKVLDDFDSWLDTI